MSYCLAMKVKIGIVEREKERTKRQMLRTGLVSVAIRRLVHLSLYGPAISYETGTRQAGFSRVYKYQLATHVE